VPTFHGCSANNFLAPASPTLSHENGVYGAFAG